MKYHIEEVQVPRGGDSPLDLGEGRRIVHVVAQVPAEDGAQDTLHVLVEDDGTGGDPRGYEGSGPGANMAAPQPAGPLDDEDQLAGQEALAENQDRDPGEQEYPANPVPGEDAAPAEPEVQEEGDEPAPAWTSASSDYEAPFERQDPETGEDGEGGGEYHDSQAVGEPEGSEDGEDPAGPLEDSGPADGPQSAAEPEHGLHARRRRTVTDETTVGSENTLDE